MSRDRILLLPPTHEQSLPAFHVEEALAEDFRAFLEAHGVAISQDLQPLGRPSPGAAETVEIEVHVDTPADRLEALRQEYLNGLDR